jgi:hypothetical protein
MTEDRFWWMRWRTFAVCCGVLAATGWYLLQQAALAKEKVLMDGRASQQIQIDGIIKHQKEEHDQDGRIRELEKQVARIREELRRRQKSAEAGPHR